MNIYVHKQGAQLGPFSIEQIRTKADAGEISGTDYAWTEGWPGWKPLVQVPGFSSRVMSVFVHKDGQQQGPFKLEDLRARVAAGRLAITDPAWIEGWSDWRALSAVPGFSAVAVPAPGPPALPAAGESGGAIADTGEPFFFYISKTRLVVMSIATCNCFVFYWMYRNWKYLKERDGRDISPFWRASFWIIYFWPLLNAVWLDEETGRFAPATFSVKGLAAGVLAVFFFNTWAGNASNPFVFLAGSLAALLISLWLLPVQGHINRANRARPSPPRYHKWTVGQVLILPLGLWMWFTILFTIFGAVEE